MRFTHWNQRSSSRRTNEILKELASVHISRINSNTVRERLTASITSNNLPDLCNFDTPYEELTVSDAANCRQVLAFFSKRADIDIGCDRVEACLQKFKEAEDLCFETNTILRMRRLGSFLFEPDVEALLFRAQRKIATILGDVPNLEDLHIRFGPGATTQVKKRTASARRKLGEKFACSEELLPVIKQSLEELQGWIFISENSPDTAIVPVEIHHGKLSLVPKSAKTHRAIVVEPSLNTMFQAGIGDYMAKRLKRAGIDISDQSLNQRLAREGSITGALATLDLSSASDTIAVELVSELLPVDWYLFLSNYRTGTIDYEGMSVKLQKFSSMGNGFTFPLETLIFYALAYACVNEGDESMVNAYGDDIIVPTYAYPALCRLLRYTGFIPNTSKSFSSGSFRESCGADYLRGIDIRPSYVKDCLHCFDIFRLHNQYVRRGDMEMADILRNYLDPSIVRWGPDGYGDGHLVRDGSSSCSPHGRSRGYAGYVFETYTFRPKSDFSVSPGDRVYPSYCAYSAQGKSDSDFTSGRSFTHRDLLRSLALSAKDGNPEQVAHDYDKKGRLGVSIPGREAYRLIKIYTLSPG